MRNKPIIMVVMVVVGSLAISAGAEEEARNRYQGSETRSDANIQRSTLPGEATATAGIPDETVLDAGIAGIEADFRARMSALKSRLASVSSSDEQVAIELQAEELKKEWTLAIAARQLELARIAGDTATETELLQAMDRIMNPPQVERTAVVRNPSSGEAVEGGSR